jgi:endoglycosylceramidase
MIASRTEGRPRRRRVGSKVTTVATGIALTAVSVGWGWTTGSVAAASATPATPAAPATAAASAAPSAAPAADVAPGSPADGPVGPMSSDGGPFLTDRFGRVVLMHGVNLVYKLPPYEIVVDGTGANVLTRSEARTMASLGFDVVRLGIIWKGLEPGDDPIDDPSVCTSGRPRATAHQFDAAVFDSYMKKLEATIALLGQYGIYSVVDMHQDVYSSVFGGEGAPNWAVCTNGQKPRPRPGGTDWTVNLQGPGVVTAYEHFWHNDVVGDLQGQFDALWVRVASSLRDNPWVVGYDPFNEPYGRGLPPYGNNTGFDAELECFYTGRADPGLDQSGGTVSCPGDDPEVGLIPQLEAADPRHLVFYEGDYTNDSGIPGHVGPMPFPRLVLNFHDYCFLNAPNGPESSGFASICSPLEKSVFTLRSAERERDTTPEQPGGPASLLTEFGASTDTSDIARIAGDADTELVGWIYWQWLRYDDPTGPSTAGLWPPDSSTPSMLTVLSRPYASAVAGTPTAMSFDPTSGRFTLQFRPDPRITQPTVVVVPVSTHYRNGYCTTVSGGRAVSPPGTTRLDVDADIGATQVTVTIQPGRC